MSDSNREEELLRLAAQQEQELGSQSALRGHGEPGSVRQPQGGSDTTGESGVDAAAASRFPGGSVTIGSTGQGNNAAIPDEEGGGINPTTGRQTKASDFEGVGGPEEKMAAHEAARPGDQDVQSNVRQNYATNYPGQNKEN